MQVDKPFSEIEERIQLFDESAVARCVISDVYVIYTTLSLSTLRQIKGIIAADNIADDFSIECTLAVPIE